MLALAEVKHKNKVKPYWRLTWHDPLTDQLLPCASLLKLELEDCMEAPEIRGEEEEKRKSARALKSTNCSDGALRRSISNNQKRDRREQDLRSSAARSSSHFLLLMSTFLLPLKSQEGGQRELPWMLLKYYTLPVLGFFWVRCVCSVQKRVTKKKKKSPHSLSEGWWGRNG